VSLRQMVQFGQNPSQGTLLRASQFLAAELPIRLAHRVKELDELPQGLHKMPSIEKVKRWYAQSFEELVNFPRPELPEDLQDALLRASQESGSIPDPVPNPSLPEHMKPRANQLKSKQGRQKIPLHRYYSQPDETISWPPEVHDYNDRFTRLLSNTKRRHDPVVTIVAQGYSSSSVTEGRRISIDRSRPFSTASTCLASAFAFSLANISPSIG